MLRPLPPNTSTARIALIYGIYTGVGMALYYTLLRFLWSKAPSDVRFMIYLVLAFGIIKGMQAFRKDNKGAMSLLQGLGVGTMLAAVAGLIQGLINLAIIFLYEPTGGAAYKNASIIFMLGVLYITLIGAVISLTASFFYKKDRIAG